MDAQRTPRIRVLGEGVGWRAADLVCSAGPKDVPLEEQQEQVSVAAVLAGSFIYRSASGRVLLSPGALLLGNEGQCYECSHEHSIGDHCVAFHVTGEFVESIARALGGITCIRFAISRVPPSVAVTQLLAELELNITSPSPLLLEQSAALITGMALRLAQGARDVPSPTTRDLRRISHTVRSIERCYSERVTLARLANEVGMSRYHFLRQFQRVVGVTPHRYLTLVRYRAAARGLRDSRLSVQQVALECGFNDLSEFTRGFSRLFGSPPARFRHAALAP
jgi:AraC family transcriptional regulator